MREELNTRVQRIEVASETDAMNRLFSRGITCGYSFAAWKLPGHSEKKILLSFSPGAFLPDTQIENLEPGFLFCPFHRNENGFYLKADLLFRFNDGKLLTPQHPVELNAHTWLNNQPDQAGCNSYYISQDAKKKEPGQYPDFLKLIDRCLNRIEEGVFEKAVPSRYKVIPLPNVFNPVDAFQKLCNAYPNALISLVSIPGAGTWLGASPEILVQIEGNVVFRTVALAGTQPYQPGTNLKQVAWTQKEIEEQALVSRYIINCFKKIRLREFEEHGPKTAVAGNLLHLKTDFLVDMQATSFPQLGSVMLNLLHPTSAVCGMPMEPALEFLKLHEGYDRQFYSGFLGPVNMDNGINVFVNLRCMQVLRDTLICYAGSGVTADSIPEKEWHETEIKMNTLLNVVL